MMRRKVHLFVIAGLLIGLASNAVCAGASTEANRPACTTPEKAAATFFTGLIQGEEALQRTCMAEDLPLPRPLPVAVTDYQLIVFRPAPLLGAVFTSWGRQRPYRTEPGDVQIGVDFLGPWDRQANVRVGEGWVFLRPKGSDNWEIHEADARADLAPQKGGPLRAAPSRECATPVQAVRTFMQGSSTRNRRMLLQCTYFWNWDTDHPQYVAQYSIAKPRPISSDMIGKQWGRFTFTAGDVFVGVRYRLAHQYRGLLHGRTWGFLSFDLRRSAEGDWKILSVAHRRGD